MNAYAFDPPGRMSLKNLAILVVDDEPDIRDIFKVMLEAYGADVTLAASGNEGLSLTSRIKFDAIVSDLTMPDGDGLYLLSELRKRDLHHPPFALVTADVSNRKKDMFELGVKTVIQKPFDFNEVVKNLLEMIEENLNSKT